MRATLLATLLLASPAGATERVVLATNKVGCASAKDLIEARRLVERANDQKSATLIAAAMLDLEAKLKTGACRRYGANTPISVERRETVQGYPMDCIRSDDQDRCFYALAPSQ